MDIYYSPTERGGKICMSRQCWRRPGLALLAVLLSMVTPAIGHAAGTDAADAAQKKDIGALRSLVQRRADVNAAQPDGTTALHWAVVWNSEEAINLLLRAGADVKARNRYGATARSAPSSRPAPIRRRSPLTMARRC